MNIVIFSPTLKATTGSPIRAFNIIEGLTRYSTDNNIILVSSAFDDNLIDKYKCYLIGDHGIEKALEIAVKENNADVLFCITHGYANIVSKVSKLFKIPFFVDIHGIRTLEILEEQSSLSVKAESIRECFPWFFGLLRAKNIFCANPMLYIWLRRLLGNKVISLCGITDVLNFECVNNKSDCVKVLYAGNLRYYQGVDLLLDAINIIGNRSDFKFYILGDIGMSEKLKSKVASLKNRSNVVFVPPISYNKYPSFLCLMDVFIVPRRNSLTTYMAFPQKLVEAMSAGKCVIATNISPHKFALTNPDCGILCSPNSHSIAEAIIKTKNGKLRRKLGKIARIKALKNYDVQVQISKILHCFSEV